MKILWSWLGDFFHTENLSPEKAAELLTRAGSETFVQDTYPWSRLVEVVQIQTCEPHPQSDHLQVCQIKTTQGEIQVVCGGANARAGLKTLWAKPGCLLPGSKIALSVCALRGIQSHGMLCGAEELALEDLLGPNEGIVELEDTWQLGQSLHEMWEKLIGQKEALLEVEITPNRGYLLSHLGVARELASLTDRSWLKAQPECANRPNNKPKTSGVPIALTVDQNIAPSFSMARLKIDAKISTPPFVRRRLNALEASLHFPAVDLTNFMAYGVGQPMHVWDAQALDGPLEVRESREGETFLGLDDKEYVLPQGLVVIADRQGIVSLAGVMGAKRGSCQEKSEDILLEVAYFMPHLVARAGQKTNIKTQARQRFERHIDPVTHPSFSAALEWLKTYTKAQVDGVVVYDQQPCAQSIVFPSGALSKLSGVTLGQAEMIERLGRLGAHVEVDNDILHVTPPTYRPLWRTQQETVEEILRLNGYKDVPITPLPYAQGCFFQDDSWKIRRFLVSKGFYETVTWSFMEEKPAHIFWQGQQDKAREKTVQDFKNFEALKLINPLSKELAVLRPSILPNLIALAQYHAAKKVSFRPIFEIGPIFYGGKPGEQKTMLSGLMPVSPCAQWHSKKTCTFFDVKEILESLFLCLQREVHFEQESHAFPYHPGQCARLVYQGQKMGFVGAFHPRHAWPYLAFEIDLGLFKDIKVPSFLTEPSALQPVEKDLSFFLKGTLIGPFFEALKKSAQPDLVALDLMDVYQEAENLSVMVRCTFQPMEKAYTSHDLQKLMEQVVVVAQKNGGTLRGQLV